MKKDASYYLRSFTAMQTMRLIRQPHFVVFSRPALSTIPKRWTPRTAVSAERFRWSRKCLRSRSLRFLFFRRLLLFLQLRGFEKKEDGKERKICSRYFNVFYTNFVLEKLAFACFCMFTYLFHSLTVFFSLVLMRWFAFCPTEFACIWHEKSAFRDLCIIVALMLHLRCSISGCESKRPKTFRALLHWIKISFWVFLLAVPFSRFASPSWQPSLLHRGEKPHRSGNNERKPRRLCKEFESLS